MLVMVARGDTLLDLHEPLVIACPNESSAYVWAKRFATIRSLLCPLIPSKLNGSFEHQTSSACALITQPCLASGF